MKLKRPFKNPKNVKIRVKKNHNMLKKNYKNEEN
jgi:hypothetical protein